MTSIVYFSLEQNSGETGQWERRWLGFVPVSSIIQPTKQTAVINPFRTIPPSVQQGDQISISVTGHATEMVRIKLIGCWCWEKTTGVSVGETDLKLNRTNKYVQFHFNSTFVFILCICASLNNGINHWYKECIVSTGIASLETGQWSVFDHNGDKQSAGPQNKICDLLALVWPIWSRVVTTSSALVKCWNVFGGPSISFTR